MNEVAQWILLILLAVGYLILSRSIDEIVAWAKIVGHRVHEHRDGGDGG